MVSSTEESLSERRRRKEEGRRKKKQKIEEAGGVRPRNNNNNTLKAIAKPQDAPKPSSTAPPPTQRQQQQRHLKEHRFGRVMDSVPCRNRSRHSTLSIAIPGSVVANCQTRELKTQLVGQIARSATIYHVDEIVIFDDKLAARRYHSNPHNRNFRPRNRTNETATDESRERTDETSKDDFAVQKSEDGEGSFHGKRSDPHEFMARVLQYCECPQYLRRSFFPMHPDLQFTGLLAPIDAPHHVRVHERSKYREGVVLEKKGPSSMSLVNCGIRGRPVEIDRRLSPGIRCTVQLDSYGGGGTGPILGGKVVSPSAPREDNGTYWGYTTRLASSLKAALDECPFEEGYDLKIGTSERGTHHLDALSYKVPPFQHALIVFGGVAGIEECVDADESLKIPGSQTKKLFDHWVNVCTYQGSRTIRSEEAVLITLAKYSPLLTAAADQRATEQQQQTNKDEAPEKVVFTDEVSDESSDEGD